MGQYSFQGNAIVVALSLSWISFTWEVVFRGLEVYSIVLAWVRESWSHLLQKIASGNWSAYSSLVPLSLLVLPIWDMAVHWHIVHHRWAASFPVSVPVTMTSLAS